MLLKRWFSRKESEHRHRRFGTALSESGILKEGGGQRRLKAQGAPRICGCRHEGKRCRGLHTTDCMPFS